MSTVDQNALRIEAVTWWCTRIEWDWYVETRTPEEVAVALDVAEQYGFEAARVWLGEPAYAPIAIANMLKAQGYSFEESARAR